MNKKQIFNFLAGNSMFNHLERNILGTVRPLFNELCRSFSLRFAGTKRPVKKVSPNKKSSPNKVTSTKKSNVRKRSKTKRIKPSSTELLSKSSGTSVGNSSL